MNTSDQDVATSVCGFSGVIEDGRGDDVLKDEDPARQRCAMIVEHESDNVMYDVRGVISFSSYKCRVPVHSICRGAQNLGLESSSIECDDQREDSEERREEDGREISRARLNGE